MSGTDYSYDDKGQFFPFFILTISGLVTLPLTYTLLKPSTDPGATAPRIQSGFVPEHAEIIEAERRKQRRRERRLKRIVVVVIGWAIIGLMAYLIHVTATTSPKIWNPYDILGISEWSSEKQIKSHYKKLSLRHHPDKVKPDPAKNETLESLNEHFVELTKAYKALTDEEVRNNYIQYGHPDGKQSFSIGIALPQFIIEEGNAKYVLIVYAFFLGVLLPYLVGSWWYGTQRMSKERVLIESANNLFREYSETMAEGDVVTALSCGVEFQELLKGDKAESGLGKLESRILAEGEGTPLAGGLSLKDKSKLEDFEGVRRKALALLWAYLGRVELDDVTLNEKRFEVAPIAHALNQAFLAITLAFASTGPILAAYSVAQSLIQAVAPKASPLLQLPYITPKIAQAIEGDSKSHMTVQQFMDIPESKRRQLALGSGLTDSQYKAAMDVSRQIPYFSVSKAFFKVTGEKFVTQGSLVSLVVKGRFIPPGSSNVPEVNELDLEDVDPDEDDLDAIMGRKKKAGKGGSVTPTDNNPIQPPLAYAPYFARDHSPQWHVFLTDSKQGKMAVPPFTFSTFDKPILTEDGKPTFNMQTLKAQFQAPPQAGRYTFVMHLICDSYVGMDTKMEVTLVVEEASKAQEIEVEDDISEPDEDSLAGQLQMMKGVPPKKKKVVQESDDDDESGTDDEDDDTSETNTDTDTDDE